jgi:hypothetical protein
LQSEHALAQCAGAPALAAAAASIGARRRDELTHAGMLTVIMLSCQGTAAIDCHQCVSPEA